MTARRVENTPVDAVARAVWIILAGRRNAVDGEIADEMEGMRVGIFRRKERGGRQGGGWGVVI